MTQFSPLPFDWLSDLSPAFAAQESWLDGSYHQDKFYHYIFHSDGPFTIACGTGLLAEHIRSFRFSPPVIQRLGQVTDAQGRCLFSESFLNHLQRIKLRVQINAAPEGSVLLPGEPLMTIQGPKAQIALLESAFRLLVWESTYWATKTALGRWKRKRLKEQDTPLAPNFPTNPDGWKIRAAYVGGATADEILKNVKARARAKEAGEGLFLKQDRPDEPIVQIRRLFRSNQPLGDIWLSNSDEEKASVSRNVARYEDENSAQVLEVKMTRFQNLYQPTLVKGHPVMAPPRLPYLRQRTLKQLEAFAKHGFEAYPRGHYV
jgi:Nicotinate phosphoribosyltransferase (NAPRTase) N-terminal domain